IDLPQGYKGYAGKNARGNEVVSFKLANGDDFWFHASDYSGSHLIVRNPKKENDLPFEVEQFALKFAAERSSAPKDNAIEVVVSKAKYIAKVKGKLGAVYVSKSKKKKIDLNKNE
ncbi:MAG: NFACT RNA binding domain-containing protein, partial [Acidobacteria bacterium]|nr:NFACT RNA binding domain-containing protein [Acidobacteriota bacterium]